MGPNEEVPIWDGPWLTPSKTPNSHSHPPTPLPNQFIDKKNYSVKSMKTIFYLDLNKPLTVVHQKYGVIMHRVKMKLIRNQRNADVNLHFPSWENSTKSTNSIKC